MDIIDKVVYFNQEVLGIEQRKPGVMALAEHEITVKCLNEEVDEYVQAHDACMADDETLKKPAEIKYVADMADAFIDNIYFAIGALYKLGMTPDQIRRAMYTVHDCNVKKKAGKNAKRDTGAADAVKPENWIGPEQKILEILRETSE